VLLERWPYETQEEQKTRQELFLNFPLFRKFQKFRQLPMLLMIRKYRTIPRNPKFRK
jgi:hypothetical protein